MTVDLDALEKLADQLVFWGRYASETEDQAKARRNGACREASEGIKALIAELKEARGLLERWQQPEGQWSANIDTSAFLAKAQGGE